MNFIEKLPMRPGTKYVSENMADLPYNCLFNKGRTGCGGTSVALQNSENYVVAVPFTSLIMNKTGLAKPGVATIKNFSGGETLVLALWAEEGFDANSMAADHVSRCKAEGRPVKILCTWDRVETLTQILHAGDIGSLRLLVDEWHELINASSYREKAVRSLLASFRKYRTFCFMSATPPAEAVLPEALRGIDECVADWGSNAEKGTVYCSHVKNPFLAAASMIGAFFRAGCRIPAPGGGDSHQLFIFLNSVNGISRILRTLIGKGVLSAEDCAGKVAIVCADKEENKGKLPTGTSISHSGNFDKPLTFFTSKGFLGIDIESRDGFCVVVSDVHRKHTAVDIFTDSRQIAGRIRTESNPYRNRLLHIYNHKHPSEMTPEKLKEEVEEMIGFGNDLAKMLNDRHAGSDFIPAKSPIEEINGRLFWKDDKWHFDEMPYRASLSTFSRLQAYGNCDGGLRMRYKEAGAEVSFFRSDYLKPDGKLAAMKPFKDACLEYDALQKKIDGLHSGSWIENLSHRDEVEELRRQQQQLEGVYPGIGQAIDFLGMGKIESMGFRKTKIMKLVKTRAWTVKGTTGIFEMLGDKLEVGQFYTNEQIENLLRPVCEGIVGRDSESIVRASDIGLFYEVKSTIKRNGGKVQRGYIIVLPKPVADDGSLKEAIMQRQNQEQNPKQTSYCFFTWCASRACA